MIFRGLDTPVNANAAATGNGAPNGPHYNINIIGVPKGKTADMNGDGTVERYNLFSDALQNYFWQIDNQGMRLLQLRFYEISTNVN